MTRYYTYQCDECGNTTEDYPRDEEERHWLRARAYIVDAMEVLRDKKGHWEDRHFCCMEHFERYKAGNPSGLMLRLMDRP